MNRVEIVICEPCKGTGEITEEKYIGAASTGEYTTYGCPDCNGTGRLVKRTVVTFVAFDPEILKKCLF